MHDPSSRNVIVIVGLLFAAVPGAAFAGILPFADNWQSDNVGDNANGAGAAGLANWQLEPSYGTGSGSLAAVFNSGANRFLRINPSLSDALGIRTRDTYPAGGATVLSISSDILVEGDGFGNVQMAAAKSTQVLTGYSVLLDDSNEAISIQEYSGTTTPSSLTSAGLSGLFILNSHNYRLTGTSLSGGTQIRLDVFIDNAVSPYLSVIDNSPVAFGSALVFSLVTDNGKSAVFDNFNATPEPATLLLLAAGTMAMRRRRPI